MRLIIGFLVTIVLLTGAGLGILALWGVYPISLDMLLKVGLTALVVCVVIFLLYLFYSYFFKKQQYNHKGDGKAHPIR